MKFINYLKTISGVEIFPLFSLIVFFVFFVALFVLVINMKKAHIKHMQDLPLEK